MQIAIGSSLNGQLAFGLVLGPTQRQAHFAVNRARNLRRPIGTKAMIAVRRSKNEVSARGAGTRE
jgi:hypothetical protein